MSERSSEPRACRTPCWLLLAALLVLAPHSVASAQSTGGSFGGGDWGDSEPTRESAGGGGSGTSLGDIDYGDSGDGDSGDDATSDPAWDDEGEYDGALPRSVQDVGALAALLLFVAGAFRLLGEVIRGQRHVRRASAARGKAGRAWNGVDVTGVSLAVDWRARAYVQQELDRLARSGMTEDRDGRARLLRETVDLLRAVRVAWLYGAVENHRPMNQGSARGIFRQLTIDRRARFNRDSVRDEQGTLTVAKPPALEAKPEEGPGVVVVTLAVAARCEILDIDDFDNANAIERLLMSLRGVGASELVALEVIWSPAAEQDRMSTLELTARYPKLQRLEERTVGGRVFCGHCLGPFPDELESCPHCGAANPSHEGRDSR